MNKIYEFQKKIRRFYVRQNSSHQKNDRDFEWRKTHDPYKILVSEMMLQQTQTSRVVEKYATFLKAFPTVSRLANVPQSEVLKLWHGLGYNRRALHLHQTAKLLCEKYKGIVPKLKNELIELPGIGPNTAGAVIAFAYNRPVVFIETNIRRVFIHEFFREKEIVSDQEIYPLIEASLDHQNPREWYYALMDYGTYLGKAEINPNRKSANYQKQSKFEGSNRQTRGKILKLLIGKPSSLLSLQPMFDNKELFLNALDQLIQEGFIDKKGDKIFLKP